MGVERQVVTRARRALELLCRGALYERRPGVRAAVMADLGAVAEAVEELARTDVVKDMLKVARDNVEEMGGRLALALDEADGWRLKLERAEAELAATRRCLEAAEEALSARVGA
jgi:hypothetical protein